MRSTPNFRKICTKRYASILIVSSISLALTLLTASTFTTYVQNTIYAQGPNAGFTAANTTANAANNTNTNTTTNTNNLNKTANVMVIGKSYQVKYSINNGQVLSIVADKHGTKLVITIQPTKNGKLTINLPRNLIDYKLAGNKDGNFVIHINGKQNVPVNVKEIATTSSSRTLSIDFGGGDRVIEIIGTQMA